MPQVNFAPLQLAALNPAAAGQSFMQALAFARDQHMQQIQQQEAEAKLRAFQQQQDELQQLQAARIAAAKANFGSDVTRGANLTAVSPSGNLAAIASNLATAATAPAQANYTLADLASKLGDLKTKEDLRPITGHTASLAALLGQGQAQDQLAAQQIKSPTVPVMATIEAQTGLAQAELAYQKAVAEAKNMPADKARADAMNDSLIRMHNAQALADESTAKFNEEAKTQGRPYQDFAAVSNAISQESQHLNELNKTPVGVDEQGKPITLEAYLTDFESKADPETKKVIEKHWFTADVSRGLPDTVKNLVEQANIRMANIRRFSETQGRLAARMVPEAGGAAVEPVASVKPNVKQNGVEYKWDGAKYVPVK